MGAGGRRRRAGTRAGGEEGEARATRRGEDERTRTKGGFFENLNFCLPDIHKQSPYTGHAPSKCRPCFLSITSNNRHL